ncbi:MAG: hydrogenase small subunit [Gemmatimonadota bacterium]|nr:hydrogenase small subunit [Gemmatimonadota bacterium]
MLHTSPSPPSTDPVTFDRRSFVKICSMAAAAVGLPAEAAAKFVQNAEKGLKPSVIWLANQECTGCTESLLRTSHPRLDELILDLISLDYHEALAVAAGHQVEEARLAAMERHKGAYICVIEGAIPTKDGGIYCKVGGKTSLELVREVAEDAGAIIAIGSCASWGGIPSAAPNPTGAKGAPAVLEGKTVVTIPGCPSNPYNFLGVALQYATFGTLPELDELGRPKFAYGRTIHEHCPRRAHFDAGRFVKQFGDEGHRQGWCLYQMGCKGPVTHANCSTLHFGEVNDAWPIGLGHPCFGCTEEGVAFTLALHDTVDPNEITPPTTYPPIFAQRPGPNPWATMALGAVVGGAIGGGIIAAKKVSQPCEEDFGPEEA